MSQTPTDWGGLGYSGRVGGAASGKDEGRRQKDEKGSREGFFDNLNYEEVTRAPPLRSLNHE